MAGFTALVCSLLSRLVDEFNSKHFLNTLVSFYSEKPCDPKRIRILVLGSELRHISMGGNLLSYHIIILQNV